MANFKCFQCSQEIVFDSEHIGKNGKKIPLDPATKQPHDCPMRNKEMKLGVDSIAERLEEKDDHGNESYSPKVADVGEPVAEGGLKYVDHTLKGQSKVKIFVSDNVDELQQLYNQFLKSKNGEIKTQGAQFQMNSSEVAIALYYEEVKA